MRRIKPLSVIAAFVVGLIVASVVLTTTRSRTPAEVIASTASPAYSMLTAPVESRKLVAAIVARATVTTPESTPLSCRPGDGSSAQVFTTPPKFGDRLQEGDLLAGVNGRPIFLLVGDIASYRPITPGIRGKDVAQLQHSLRRLGYYRGEVNGKYSSDTQLAVRKMYESRDYEPVGPTLAEQDALQAAKDAIRDAKEGVASAPPESEDQAKRTLRGAQEALKRLQATTGTTVPYCEIVFAPSAPASLSKTAGNGAGIEEGASDGWAQINAGAYILKSNLRLSDETLLSDGADVDIDLTPVGGDVVKGTLSVGAGDSGDPAPERGVSVTVTPNGPVPENALGTNLKITVRLNETEGDVLVVPLAALTGTADGKAKVVKIVGTNPNDTNNQIDVVVVPGITADGFVEVRPVSPGSLVAGDTVGLSAKP